MESLKYLPPLLYITVGDRKSMVSKELFGKIKARAVELKATGFTPVEMQEALTSEFNENGDISVGAAIGLCISLVVVAAVVPTAITAIVGANTTGWDTGTIAIWGVLGIAVVGGIVARYVWNN
jgi:hypothetical protein